MHCSHASRLSSHLYLRVCEVLNSIAASFPNFDSNSENPERVNALRKSKITSLEAAEQQLREYRAPQLATSKRRQAGGRHDLSQPQSGWTEGPLSTLELYQSGCGSMMGNERPLESDKWKGDAGKRCGQGGPRSKPHIL